MYVLRGLGAPISPISTGWGPTVTSGGLPDAPPNVVTNPYGRTPLTPLFPPAAPPQPGGQIVVDGNALTPGASMVPTSPGPVYVPPQPQPSTVVDPARQPPSAGPQASISDDNSLVDAVRATLTPVRIAAAALAIGAAVLGAVAVSRVRRRHATSTD
jgi:hypothetical protein